MDDDGYVLIKLPDHPFARADGYVAEHRLVAEAKIGRYLLPHEDGHHINEIKDDNRPENIEVITRPDHSRLHANARWRKGTFRKVS